MTTPSQKGYLPLILFSHGYNLSTPNLLTVGVTRRGSDFKHIADSPITHVIMKVNHSEHCAI